MKYIKTTSCDYKKSEVRLIKGILRDIKKVGQTSIIIQCPFCSAEVRLYLWSYASVGKRCSFCGAMLRRNEAFRKILEGK